MSDPENVYIVQAVYISFYANHGICFNLCFI